MMHGKAAVLSIGKKVGREKRLGGLGVKDLVCFNRALWMHWAWLQWTEWSRPWTSMNIQLTEDEQELFRVCTTITEMERRKKFGKIVG
jgi:hypothetical protein